MPRVNIFVEGDNDANLVDTYIRHFALPNDYKIERTGGWQGLGNLNPLLQQNRDTGLRNVVVFDADGNPAQRRQEILDLLSDSTVIHDIFLFPDNNSAGKIETLLINSMNPAHAVLNGCFTTYRTCIQATGNPYVVPDDKTLVFAYLSALGKEYNVKKINYADPDSWDLGHALIQNFVAFLNLNLQ